MKTLLWIDLNCSYAHSSLALPAIHAQMPEDAPIEWQTVSATINENWGSMTEKITQQHPDIVAGTLWLFNHEAMMHIVSRVKVLIPDVCVVLGGPEFLGDNETFLRNHPYVDAVFRGEGEEMVPRWLTQTREADDIDAHRDLWQTLAGFCYLDRQSRYHDGGKAVVMHFDRLAMPESSRFFNWSKPFVQLETTRGCFNTCAFCVSGGEKPVRTLSLDAIRQRLDRINRQGIANVRVLDRTFNYNPAHARRLLSLFCEYPHIRFHLEIHPALLTPELRAHLAQMPHGLLHLEAGIQSLRQEVLTLSRRKGTLERALDGLRYLCSLPNMETHADLIAGLPGYTLTQIFEDIRTLASYRAGEIQLESLKLLPGTEMRARASELGIRHSPLPPYEVLATRETDAAQLQTARQLSRLLDAYYNTPAWQDITRRLILDDDAFLPHFLAHLTRTGLIDQPMSLEKRGLLLHRYCKQYYPAYATQTTVAWIEAGLSLKKEPAEKVRTKHIAPPETGWKVVYGTYRPTMRLACLAFDEDRKENGSGKGRQIWFGFDSEKQETKPIFRAETHFLEEK